jgi:hypothetical protein
MLILAINGTARNAQTIHHIPDQNIRDIIITKELRLSLFPITLGSIIFPEINCGINKHASNIKDKRLLSNWTKLYRNGSERATIPQIVGIKSKRNTRSPNIRAYSSQNTNIIMILVTPFARAKKNLERKKIFISE